MADPKRLRVAGTTYTIHWADAPIFDDAGDAILGDCDDTTKTIRMSLTASGHDQKRSTLLHESLHATSDELNYGWTEKMVLQAERVMFMLLRDNPGYVRWLMQKHPKE